MECYICGFDIEDEEYVCEPISSNDWYSPPEYNCAHYECLDRREAAREEAYEVERFYSREE